MRRFAIVTTFAAIVGALALWQAPQAQAEEAKCGEKGQPNCPLQDWMEKHLQDAMDKNDLAAVGVSLEKVAAMVPDPKWNDGATGWAKIAKDGAAAAKAGKADEVKAACKSCHKAWRNQYKKNFRTRPVSG